MALVTLYRDEFDDLPGVCARSGEYPTRRVRKTFSWHPSWVLLLLPVGLVPYFLVAMMLTKRMTVTLPLCDRHANHWLLRGIVIVGGALGLILVLGFGAALLEAG